MKKQLVLAILLLVINFSFAQDVLLNDAQRPQSEFSTAINPTDTNNIVLVTMHGFDDVTQSFLTIYYTNDFGETWDVSDFHGKYEGHLGAGDPVVQFDENGTAYLVNLVVTENDEVLTMLSRSQDGGQNWEEVFTHSDQFTDKPWLGLDRSDQSPHQGNIYIPVVSDELILLSIDDNFQLVNNTVIPDGYHLPSVVINKDGEIFTCDNTIDNPNELYVQHYTDEGATLVHSTLVASFPDYTFDTEDISFRFQPTAYLAIDNSDGPYSGRIYLSYTASESDGSNFFDVYLIYSDDLGRTWSPAKIIHRNNDTHIQQFYSSSFVNDEGVLILDWYDREDHSDLKTDFMMGISYDGGESFEQIKLNSEPMDFTQVVLAGFEFGIGEYHQLVATDHTAISFWSDGRTNDGDLNIYFAKVSLDNQVSGVDESGLVLTSFGLTKIYPQPANSSLNVEFDLKKDYVLKHRIRDAQGRILEGSSWKNYSSGPQKLNIPTPFQAGSYFLELVSKQGYIRSVKFTKA